MALTEREKEVLHLRRRPGLHGKVTLRDLGRRWGVSAVRVKQIEDNALRKVGEMYLDQFFKSKEGAAK